jgi:signal transduction histidine kinase
MSLSARLMLLILAPMIVMFLVYGAFANQLRRQRYLERAAAEVADMSVMLRTVLHDAVAQRQPGKVEALIERLTDAKHIMGIGVFDAEGRQIAMTREMQPQASTAATLARRSLAERREAELDARFGSVPVLLRAIPLDGGGVAILGRDLSYVDRDVAEADRVLGAAAVALLIAISLPVIVLVRSTIVRPTRELVLGVERVSAGQIEAQVAEEGAVELRRLAGAFNRMTESLVQARQEAQAQAEARAVMERRVQHNQALAAAGQLAASVAHEIGSPLNIILGRARLSAEDASCPELVRQDLQTIAEQCERISRVLRQLLAVVREPTREEGQEAASVAEVTSRVIDFVGPEGRARRVTFSSDPPGTSVGVSMNPDRLFQVLFNLCMNAMQAQPDGGKVSVRIRDELSQLSGESCVAIEVEDEGPGVPTELLGKITSPFFTTKAPGEGSGLGLAIVDGLVRDAGGRLEVENREEKGARFRVVLPKVEMP